MKRFLPLVAGIASVICVFLIYQNTGTLYKNLYDDSYIEFRYAVNLAEHNELVFTLGERMDAASSFLYTVVLAFFYSIGIYDMEKVSYLLNILALGFIAAFVYLSAFRLSRCMWASIVLALITSLHGFISGWACLGMDTIPYVALLVMWAYWTFVDPRRWPSFALTFLLVLMRVEGALAVPFWFIVYRDWRGMFFLSFEIICYYLFKYAYYDTILPHSYLIKTILKYYQPDPMQILYTWKAFAVAAPVMAIVGVIMDKRVRWFGMFIVIMAVAVLFGVRSDFSRYSVMLFPPMLICGAPIFRKSEKMQHIIEGGMTLSFIRRWIFAPLVLAVLLFQGFHSLKWMYGQCSYLAPIQEARAKSGEWLEKNADRSIPVISGDIGSIAYHAPHIRFIDTIGLTSKDVLDAYRHGDNLDTIIKEKRPQYICDTFSISDGILIYTHGDGSFVKGGNPSNIPTFSLIWGEQFGSNLAIAITEIKGGL